MAAEESTLRGFVVGEEGKPVAGWVSLGIEHPQRWLSHTVRIETSEGYEVTIEDLGSDSIVPVTKLDVKWGAIEHDELARLCYREAPAPDIDVQFRDAILRGGDPIVVWGEVADHGYAGGEDTQSPAYRGAAVPVIARLQARVVAYGENCEEFFTDARDRWLAKHRPVDKPRAKVATKAPPVVDTAAIIDRDYHDRLKINLPLILAGVVMVAAAVIAAITGKLAPSLLIASAAACLPLALDAQLLPRFRLGATAPASLEVPFVAYILTAIGTCLFAFGTSMGDVDPGKAEGVRVFSYVVAIGAVASAGFLWVATRRRRRWISIMRTAPRHSEPLRDGIWGASDGAFSTEVMSIGERVTMYGTATKDAAGIKQRSMRTDKFANLTYQADMLTNGDRKVRRIRLGEAAILTMTKFTRAQEGMTALVITSRTPVRIVGRTQNGVFVKAGEASLLVFASASGTDVAKELDKIWLRGWIAQGLGLLGVVCLVLAFVF